MNGRQFLELADALCACPIASCSGESQLRSSVSRAYYGAFLAMRDALADSHSSISYPSDAAAHKKLYYDLKNADVPEAAVKARQLDNLRKWRNNSDYETNQEINCANAKTALKIAHECLDWFFSSNNGQDVAAGVMAYRRKTNQ